MRLHIIELPEPAAGMLSELVAESIDALAKRLGTCPAPCPGIVFSNRGWTDGQVLALTPAIATPKGMRQLGHEVTHLLHNQLMPELNAAYGQDLPGTNLYELVAAYGGLTFYRSSAGRRLRPLARAIDVAVSRYDIRSLPSKDSGYELDWRHDYETHEGGCRAADFLYRNFASRYFREFANMDVGRAQERLEELGHPYPLYAPYQAGDQYTIMVRGREETFFIINELPVIEVKEIS